jgi:hypothetical protein
VPFVNGPIEKLKKSSEEGRDIWDFFHSHNVSIVMVNGKTTKANRCIPTFHFTRCSFVLPLGHGGDRNCHWPTPGLHARQVTTGYNIARQTRGKVFITSMCIGTGMGMAAVFTSE